MSGVLTPADSAKVRSVASSLGVSLLQVGALMAAGWLRGSHFHATASGVAWFTGAVLAFTVFMYGLAEILANRIPTQEEYEATVAGSCGAAPYTRAARVRPRLAGEAPFG